MRLTAIYTSIMTLIDHTHIRSYQTTDRPALIPLIAAFRVELAALRGDKREPEQTAAAAELAEYRAKGMPLFVAELELGEIAGYLVCRVDDDVVWAESLFVAPAYRRRGIAGKLYNAAEQLAAERGAATVYNWIHPNNDAVIAFLRRRGYDVLNLLEVRKPLSNEALPTRLKVGNHEYRY